jgi:hypothetical protein
MVMKKITLEQAQLLTMIIGKELHYPKLKIIAPLHEDMELPENEQFVVFLDDKKGEQERDYLAKKRSASVYLMQNENGQWEIIEAEHSLGAAYSRNGDPGDPPSVTYNMIGVPFDKFEDCLTGLILKFINDRIKEAIMLYEIQDFIN